MPAAVEVSGFEAAFASRGVPGWHMLGTVFDQDKVITTSEMLDLAHLSNWNVRLADIDVSGISEDRWAVPGRAIVRTNPFDGKPDVLGFVGGRYVTVQNEEAFEFGDMLLGGGAQWETAGSILDGRKVFGSLLIDNRTLDPKGRADKVTNYLLVATSHDGSMPLTALNTPTRVVCANTLQVALSGTKTQFKIRHTTSVEGKVQAARETLALNVAYFDEFSKMANAMIETEITKATFDKIVAAAYPAPDKDAAKAAVTRHANRLEMLEAIYTGTADGPDTMANVTGTAWGAFNALTEAVDWYRKPRKGDAEAVLVAQAGFDAVTLTEKNRLAAVVRSFA